MTLIAPADGIKGPMIAKVLARNANIFDGFLSFDTAFRQKGKLSATLREAVRRATSHLTGCEYCNSLGDVDELQGEYEVRLAVSFARHVAVNGGEIDQELFRQLREVFSEEEVVELVAWTCFVCIGGQLFGSALGLEPAHPTEIERFKKWTFGEI